MAGLYYEEFSIGQEFLHPDAYKPFETVSSGTIFEDVLLHRKYGNDKPTGHGYHV